MATIGAALSVVALLLPVWSATPAASEIVVTTVSDAVNGDVAGVERLLANPGADGISLREAIDATNNDPGTYTIRFAPTLRGRTIRLDDELPPLEGGGVTIEGSGVVLRGQGVPKGFRITSSRNQVRDFTLEGFDYGLFIEPPVPVPTNQTFADNTVSGLVMRGIRVQGIVLDPTASGNCRPPCRAVNRWLDTTLADNVIEARLAGIMVGMLASGARVERISVTGNRIRVTGPANGPGIGLVTGGDSTGARIADALVARNRVEGSPDLGIMVIPGADRAQAGVVERVRIIDNRLHLARRGSYFCCQGIVVAAGSDAPELAKGPPLRYLDDNAVRDVLVRGNSISGTLQWGVQLDAGFGNGGRRNVVRNVRVERNTIRSSSLGTGVYLVTGDGTPYKNRYATGNRIRDVSIDGNRIVIGRSEVGGRPALPGGVAVQGGGRFGRGNSIRDVRIRNNRIATSQVGISVVGGLGSPSRANSVSCVREVGNRITGTRTPLWVRANAEGASGNRARLGGC